MRPEAISSRSPKIFRVGLAGAGFVSQFHVAALQRLPNARIVGVCDLDEELANRLAERCHATAYTSLDALIDGGVDTIHVLTPPHTHASLTIQALERKCHVLVEKPLATSVEDCDRISEAVRRAGTVVCVNHSLLRDPMIVKAISIVKSGAIGEVVAVDYLRSSDYPAYRGGPLPVQFRDGGYPFRDLGVHGLYLVEAFLGKICEVTGQFRNRSGDTNLLYDEWRVLVNCERGSGHIQLSWSVRPLQNLLIVQGTRGVVRANLFQLTVTTQRSTPLPKSIERALNGMNEARQVLWQVPVNAVRFLCKNILPYHGLQALIADFYSSLALGAPVPVTPEQATPIVSWTEDVARPADKAKKDYLENFSPLPTAKVLVTGATGFIGQHLLRRLLSRHDRVRILVRREPAADVMNDPRIDVVLGELGDPEAVNRAVAGAEVVYHVGAATKGDAEDFERGTVAGTANVVDAVLKHRIPKLIYISSLSVLHIAAAARGAKITESWPLEPHAELRGAYARTKLEAEKLVLLAAKSRGLPVVVLRPGQVFGPGGPLLTPAVAFRVRNRLVVLGDGEVPLPLIYVEDLVDAIDQATQANRFDGSVYHLVDSSSITQNQLLAQWLVATRQPLTVVRVPRIVVDLVAHGVEVLAKLLGRPAPLSRYRVRSALSPMSLDCSAAKRALGWSPRIGVHAGLKETLVLLSPRVSV